MRRRIALGLTSVIRGGGASYVEDTVTLLFNRSRKEDQRRITVVVALMDFEREEAEKKAGELWWVKTYRWMFLPNKKKRVTLFAARDLSFGWTLDTCRLIYYNALKKTPNDLPPFLLLGADSSPQHLPSPTPTSYPLPRPKFGSARGRSAARASFAADVQCVAGNSRLVWWLNYHRKNPTTLAQIQYAGGQSSS